MNNEQVRLWADIQTSITIARFDNTGLTLQEIAEAIAENLEVAECITLAQMIDEEGKKKARVDEVIH